VTLAGREDLEEVIALLAMQQARPDRNVAYLGMDANGIRAELAELAPPWEQTAHVVRVDGAIIATAHADWDVELGRAWIHGPWVAGDDDDWTTWADAVLDAVLDALPAGVTDIEMCGDRANARLGALATARGLGRGEPAHVLELALSELSRGRSNQAVRLADPRDLETVARLHDAEFPATVASAEQLFEDADGGERVLLVAEDESIIVGYAAGRVLADGEGYIDFIAVDPAARGRRVGEALVTSLVQALGDQGARPRVCLVVDERRVAARSLYKRLGFTEETVIVGYRGRYPSGNGSDPP
jgi:ribosomal protein S18 acetylase RimI-like enzyme